MEVLTFGQVMGWLSDAGAAAALLLFGLLFWKGQIVSRTSVDTIMEIHKAAADKLASTYETQVKIMSNGFLAKLDESTGRQSEAVDNLVIAIRENVSESRQSRERMQEVVRDFTKSLSAIEAKQNGVAASPRRRSKK